MSISQITTAPTPLEQVGKINKIINKLARPITTLATSGTVALSDYSDNEITPSGAVTLSLPSVTDTTVTHTIYVLVNMSTVYSFDVGTDLFFNDEEPDLSEVGTYYLLYMYDKTKSKWKCGCLY